MGKWSYEVEGWKGRHIKVNGLGWASIDDMFRAHNHDVENMEKQIFDLAAQNAETQDENNRLDWELDEARKRIAELESPLRVPFSDAQIERMAKDHMGVISPGANWEHADKQYYMNVIRAALAAGGLEPCANPADVALSSRVPELEKQIAQLRREREDARREVDEVRRHISVTMSREHQARKEAQETKRELSHLHPGETVDGVIVERDHYRIRLERAEQDVAALRAELAELRDQIDDDNTNAAAVNDLLIQLQNVTAERDEARAELAAAEIELADKAFYVREFAAVSAERDAARAELAAMKAQLDETERQLQAEKKERFAAEDELAALKSQPGWELDVTWQDLYNTYQTKLCGLQGSWEAILDLCRSRIRPRTYTDADVEKLARVLRAAYMKECHIEPSDCPPSRGYVAEARAAMDWMGAPVGECKECEKLRKRGDKWADDCVKLAGAIKNAHAALEGE